MDNRAPDDTLVDVFARFRDGEFGELLSDVKRIAHGLDGVRELAGAALTVSLDRGAPKLTVHEADAIARLDGAIVTPQDCHPTVAYMRIADLRILRRLLRRLESTR